MRKKRSIGREHDDARALIVPLGHQVGDLATDGNAVDPKELPVAEVRQHEGADHEPGRNDARRCPDPALEIHALHAGPGTDAPHGDVASARAVERCEHIGV